MKRFAISLLMLATVLTAFGMWIEIPENASSELLEISSRNAAQLEVKFSLNGYSLETEQAAGREFARVSYPGEIEYHDHGKPELPSFSRLLAIPDADDVSFEIIDLRYQTVEDLLVYPQQEKDEYGLPISFTIDEDFYTRDQFHPQDPVMLGEPAVIRGLNVVNLIINPFQYNPATRVLRVISNLEIRMNTSNRNGSEPEFPERKLSRFFEPLFEATILNYGDIPTRDGEFQQPSYLFIYASSSLLNLTGGYDLQDVIDWKRRKGFEVNIASITETGSSTTSIKNYIQNAYNNWENPPEFVCLVGDPSSSFNVPCYSYSYGSTDHNYAMLDGGDVLADVFLGRLSVDSENDMKVIANKILGYEMNPFFGNPDWFTNVCLVGDPTSSGASTISTCKYIKEMILDYSEGFTFDEYYSGGAGSFFQNSLNGGASYFAYRGYIGMSGIPSYISGLNNGWMMPFVACLTCGTGGFDGEATSENFLEAGTATLPSAAIGAVGTATSSTHTCFNNAVTSGMFHGLFQDRIYSMGASLVRGKLALYENYHGSLGQSAAEPFFYWNNLMGDPGLELWTGQPQPISVVYDANVPIGTNYLQVYVEDSNGVPLSDAWVTAINDDMDLFATAFTDASGFVYLPIEASQSGQVNLTVTAHNKVPHLGNFTIIQSNYFVSVNDVDIDDDNEGSSSGNSNGLINPGESIELTVDLQNFGVATIEGVTGIISCNQTGISVPGANAIFGDIPVGGIVSSQNAFVFTVAPDVPGGTEIILNIQIASTTGPTWQDRILLSVRGPYLEILSYSVYGAGSNNIIDPGETVDLQVLLLNSGQTIVYDLQGELWTNDERITINDSNGSFGTISSGGQGSNSTNRFNITANQNIYPGTLIPLNLDLISSSGFAQTLTFSLQVGNASVTDPLGPDAYGYYCYDDGDTGYPDTPEYDWIEIDPEVSGYQFAGTILNLTDPGQTGNLVHQDLPVGFHFQFYGVQYEAMSICSNGFISPGYTENYEHMNWHIPGPQGPDPMIAPFWDDLVINYSGNVCYYHNAQEHYIVVEWSHAQNQQTYAEETFQVIIYDANFYPTTTNDSKIKFQYKVVNNNDQGSYPSQHGLFATVGIVDHTNSVGLEYTFDNDYPPAAKPLQNQMALLFAPSPIPSSGPYVYVQDYGIFSGHDNIIEVGETVYMSLTLRNIGPDDATDVNVQFQLDDEYITVIDGSENYGTLASGEQITIANGFILEVSELVPDNHFLHIDVIIESDQGTWVRSLNLMIYAPPDLSVNVTSFDIQIEENSVIEETMELTNIVVGSGALHYEIRVEEPDLANRNLTGSYISCGIGTFEPGQVTTWTFYAYNYSQDNEWVTDINIHFPYGVTVTNATNFIGGSGGEMAYDSQTGENITINWHGATGLGYGYLHQNQMAYSQVSVIIDEIFSGNIVLEYEMIGDGFGAEPHEISGEMTLKYPLGWVSVYPPEGVITGGETDIIDITFDSDELEIGTYYAVIIINDGTAYETNIPVTLEVISTSSGNNDIPLYTALTGNYPNPFNPSTTIRFSLSEAAHTQLTIYNLKGETVKVLHDGELPAAHHQIIWDGRDAAGRTAASGVYLYQLNSGSYNDTRKMILMK